MASTYEGKLTTGVVENTGTINGTVITSPIANPATETYTSAQSVSLTAEGSTSIRYTTDGTTPTCSTGNTYSGPISVSSTQTIKAIACYDDSHYSSVSSYTYTINIPANNPVTGNGVVPSSGGGNSGTQTPPPAAPSNGDITKDGKIDIMDFSVMMSQWGKTGTGLSADLNNDGKIDIFDFSMLMANWIKL